MNKAIQHEHGRYRPVHCDEPKPDDNWPYHDYPTTPHDPEFGVKNPKFERHVFIRRDQIFYDIDAQIQMVASSRRNADGTENEIIQQATEKFRPMFYRWIDKNINTLKSAMSAFILEQFTETTINSIKDKEEVDITLLMPEWYDDTTFPQLSDAIHNYVVDATLYEYFNLTLAASTRRGMTVDPITIEKKQQMADDIANVKKLIHASKPGAIHKIQKPF